MKLHKQKRGHQLHKFLSWLLILGTVLSVFAGSSLSVSAEEYVGSSGDIVKEDGYIYEFVMMTHSDNASYNRWTGLAFPADSNAFIFYNSSLKAYCIRGFDFSNNKVVNVSFTTVSPYYMGGNTAFPSENKFYSPSMCGSVFFYHNAYDYTCSFSGDLYIFSSLADAEAYYINNNTAGILQEPGWDDSSQVDEAWFQELIDKIKDWTGGMFEILVAPLELLAKGIDHGVQLILDLLPDKIANALRSIYEAQKELAGNTLGKIVDLHDFLVGKSTEFLTLLTDIHGALTGLAAEVYSYLPQGIKDVLEPFLIGFHNNLEKVSDGIDHLGNKFSDWLPTFNEIRDRIRNSKVGEAVEYIKGDFSKFKDKFVLFYDAFTDFVSKYDNPAQLFRDVFAEGLKMALLPDADDIREKLDSISAKIDSIRDLQAGGLHILQFLQNAKGTSPPVITVNLGSAAGKYNLGNQTVTLDFAWYAPYKPMVDQLLGAVIWANFLWNIFKRLPDIISGAGMVASNASKIGKNLK